MGYHDLFTRDELRHVSDPHEPKHTFWTLLEGRGGVHLFLWIVIFNQHYLWPSVITVK